MESIIKTDHLDIFAAYAGFKGHVGYDLSMIKDFDIDDVRKNKIRPLSVSYG